MKHLKISIYLLLTAAIFTSCEKETIALPENSELKTQPSEIENLSARTSISFMGNELYALDRFNSSIFSFDYNPLMDEINLNMDFESYTYVDTNFGFDYNIANGLIYMLAGNAYDRNLYSYDIDTNELTFIDDIASIDGNIKPQDLTFDASGNLYFVFQSGEVNKYNLSTKMMSAFANVNSSGGSGLTYDFDNNRLIYVTGVYTYSNLYAIDIPSGDVNYLFQIYYAGLGNNYNNAIEYVGNNKLIASGVWDHGEIRSINLDTQEQITIGGGNYLNIKDFMYFNNPDLDGDGVLNENDPFPYSNFSEIISIGGNDLNIDNVFVKPGTTMMDQIDALVAEINAQYNGDNYAYLHKRFMTKLSAITYYWIKDRLITSKQRSKISSAAWGAEIPYFNQPD